MNRFFVHPYQVVIIILSIAINFLLFYKYGIKIVEDSGRYLEYASILKSTFYFDPHNFWYIGYSLYILIIQLFQGGVIWIVIGQYFFSLIAVIALYHAAMNVWNNDLSAFFSALLFLVFIDISSWNSYVLTESLYTSFTCFSLYLLSKAYYRKVNTLFIAMTVVVVLFTIFIKPTGIALGGALLMILTFKFIRHLESRLIAGLVVLLVVCCFVYLVNQRLSTYLIMENYQLGEVIYAVTTFSDRSAVEAFIFAPPNDLYNPSSQTPPLLKVVFFIFHHPGYWLKLFSAKVFYLLVHIRPFWSTWHNVLSLIVLIPSYSFIGQVLIIEKSKRTVILFALLYLLIHVLSVGITSEDWDGRFLMPMLPVIFILAGHGLAKVVEKIKIALKECLYGISDHHGEVFED